MTMTERFETAIWKETPSPEDPFQASHCYCHGYDVHEDLLAHAGWFEVLFLLLTGARPSAAQAQLFERVAIISMNPGIRDLGVRAAMNAGVGRAPAGSVLVAAISAGAGQFGGAREVSLAMQMWTANRGAATFDLSCHAEGDRSEWPTLEHIPGFDPHARVTSAMVLTSIERLLEVSDGGFVSWLRDARESLEGVTGAPLSMTGVLAAAYCDLGFSAAVAEYASLILRLPGAAAHALEQRELGWRKFPFHSEFVRPQQQQTPERDPPDITAAVREYLDDSK